MDSSRRKMDTARLSIASNIALTIVKVLVGIATHSVGILADAVHSAADLFAATVAYFAVRLSGEAPDERHPYGHGKVESISGAFEALLLVGAAALVGYEAARRLVHPHHLEQLQWGVGLMAVSVALNLFVSARLYRVALETESVALRADAANLRADVYASLAVLLGLVLVRTTGVYLFDPLVALAVSLYVFRMATQLIRPALEMLVDTRLPEDELRKLEAVLQADPRVLGFHKLRSRRAGSARLVDLHLQVSDALSFQEAHRLTEEVEARLRQELPNTDVLVHTEPHDEEARHQAEAHGQRGQR